MKKNYSKVFFHYHKMEQVTSKKKYAIYTAILGDYDDLKEPENETLLKEVDYYCFTDKQDLKSSKINIIHIQRKFKDLTKSARYIKVLGHTLLNNYEFVIWVDASFKLSITSVSEFHPAGFSAYPLATFRHPFRRCIYEEALICIYAYRDFYYRLLKQVLVYKIEGMPKNYELYETGIIVFNNFHPQILSFRNKWWKEIEKGSRRDQISLPYCVWKFNFKIGILEGHSSLNKYSTHYNHFKKDNIKEVGYIKTLEWIEKNTPYLRRFASGVVKLLIGL